MRCPFASSCGEVKMLQARVAELERRLAIYKSAGASRPQREFPRRRRERTEVRYPGRPEGYPGKTRPVPNPSLFVGADWLDGCPECGSELGPPIKIRRRVLEELPSLEPVRAVEFEEIHYHCIGCGSRIISRHPECPPEGRFGKNVCVQTTLLKFEERLPERKIVGVLERQGLTIAPATVLDIHRRVGEWLRPEHDRILMNVRNSEVVYTDQTGIGVDGRNYWIWDFVTGSETLFAIRESKSQKVLEEVLGKGWDGTLVCDGLRSHHSFARKSGAKVQRCWAHLLRDAKGLAEKCAEAKALDEGLHRIFDRLKKALEKEPPPGERARLARNAKRAMRRLMNKRYKKARVRKFIEKIQRGYPYWFTAVTTPSVELTNNRAELALREIVVQRKIIGTLRNSKGTSIYETIMTLLSTWKQRGLGLPEALSASLTRVWATASRKS